MEKAGPVKYLNRAVEPWAEVGVKDLLIVALLMLLGLGLRVWNVDQPADLFFDEIYYVDAAQKLMAGKPDPNSVHPPLSKWMIGIGMEAAKGIWGPDVTPSFSWRFAAIVAGVLMVGATYGFALMLFNFNRVAAGLAGFIVATEHLHLSMTRIAMLDPFLALFCLLGTWFSVAYFMGYHERWAVLGAFLLGLATACKWSGLLTAFGCFLACAWMERLERPMTRTTRYFFWLLLLVPAGFFLSYFHLFIIEGWEWSTFGKIFNQGERMVNFRGSDKFTHGYISSLWSWPLVTRPIWLFYEQDGKGAHAAVQGIISMGLPLLWWGYLVLMIERAVHAVKKSELISGALVLIWLGQWLPWVAKFSGGGFFYYMLPEVPIMACLVGKFLADLANFDDPLGIGRWRFWLLMGFYLISVALYYPFVSAMTTNRAHFDTLFFLPNWI